MSRDAFFVPWPPRDTTKVPPGMKVSEFLKAQPATEPAREVQPGDYLNGATSAQRKEMPICTGVLDYFPDALAAVAEHSKTGNDKHNPGEPLHWAREKSTDQADCILRHLAARGTRDADGTRHSAGLAWRALALLQLEIEAEVAARRETT
jgi:hypothetical protein